MQEPTQATPVALTIHLHDAGAEQALRALASTIQNQGYSQAALRLDAAAAQIGEACQRTQPVEIAGDTLATRIERFARQVEEAVAAVVPTGSLISNGEVLEGALSSESAPDPNIHPMWWNPRLGELRRWDVEEVSFVLLGVFNSKTSAIDGVDSGEPLVAPLAIVEPGAGAADLANALAEAEVAAEPDEQGGDKPVEEGAGQD